MSPTEIMNLFFKGNNATPQQKQQKKEQSSTTNKSKIQSAVKKREKDECPLKGSSVIYVSVE